MNEGSPARKMAGKMEGSLSILLSTTNIYIYPTTETFLNFSTVLRSFCHVDTRIILLQFFRRTTSSIFSFDPIIPCPIPRKI